MVIFKGVFGQFVKDQLQIIMVDMAIFVDRYRSCYFTDTLYRNFILWKDQVPEYR